MRPTCEEVFRWGTQRSSFLANGGLENSDDDPVKLHGVKRCSIFFLLPYWKVSEFYIISKIPFQFTRTCSDSVYVYLGSPMYTCHVDMAMSYHSKLIKKKFSLQFN